MLTKPLLRPLTAAVALASVTTTLPSLAETFALEEIVVTAQKRAQDMQDVPIAVTAMNEDLIQQAGITNVAGVAARTPGFSMGEFNPTQPQLFIRGIGSNGDGAGGGEQSVAMFVDGVYVNRSAGTGLELFDIAGIEVLRGPQGTLWGKNAIAGAINITTQKPADEFSAKVEIGAGNYDLRSYRGMITGPLTESLNAKFTYNQKDRDPYVESVISDIETGDIDSSSARAQFLLTPSDSVEILISMDYGEDERTGVAAIPNETSLVPAASNAVGLTLAAMQAANLIPTADFHENYLEDAGHTKMDSQGASVQVDRDLDDKTLTSITAYRESKTSFSNISLGVGPSAFPLLDVDNYAEESSRMISQELRLAGDTENVNWQTGLYFNQEKTSRNEGGNFQGTMTGGFALSDDTFQKNETTSYAAFAQATYAATDRLDLTLGIRYTKEEKDFENRGISGAGLYVLEDYNVAVDESWNSTTYKFVANYQLLDDTMVYASAASGFKSGGFDGVATGAAEAASPFEQEEALNLEIGFKSMLVDNRLRLNGALFHTSYDDLQLLQTFDDGNPATLVDPLKTINAGEAKTQGIELEAEFALTENWRLSGTYAYLDTEYTKFQEGLTPDLVPNEGNKLRNAPRNAWNLAVSYSKDLSIGGAVDARLEYVAKDKAYQDIQNFEHGAIPAYRIYNMRMAYTSADEQWEVAGWVNNAFDEEYYAHNYQISPFGAFHVPALPRTYGLTLTYSM
jgi:iron complex outermembrane receptor protein